METDTIAALVFGTAFFGFWAWLIALHFKAHPYRWKTFEERRRLRDHNREQREKWVTNNPEKHKLSKIWEHGTRVLHRGSSGSGYLCHRRECHTARGIKPRPSTMKITITVS